MSVVEEPKKTFIYRLITVLPRKDEPFLIETHASDKQVGWVLPQSQGDLKDCRLVGQSLGMLTDAEEKYDTTQLECSAGDC